MKVRTKLAHWLYPVSICTKAAVRQMQLIGPSKHFCRKCTMKNLTPCVQLRWPCQVRKTSDRHICHQWQQITLWQWKKINPDPSLRDSTYVRICQTNNARTGQGLLDRPSSPQDGSSLCRLLAVCPGGQEGQQHPGLYQKQCGQQDQGSGRPLYLALVRPHLKSRVQFGPLTARGTCRGAGACPENGQGSWGRVWSTSLMRSGWGNWGCLVCRGGGSGGPYRSLQLPERRL